MWYQDAFYFELGTVQEFVSDRWIRDKVDECVQYVHTPEAAKGCVSCRFSSIIRQLAIGLRLDSETRQPEFPDQLRR
jgi:hypothetical protein